MKELSPQRSWLPRGLTPRIDPFQSCWASFSRLNPINSHNDSSRAGQFGCHPLCGQQIEVSGGIRCNSHGIWKSPVPT